MPSRIRRKLYIDINQDFDEGYTKLKKSILFHISDFQKKIESHKAPHLLLIGVRCGHTYTVESGRPIVLKYGAWGTKNYELAIQNAEHLKVNLMVDGKTVNGIQQSPISRDHVDYSKCDNLEDGSYWIMHVAHLEPFTEGEHVIEFEYLLDEQITDGFGSKDDGTPAVYGPGKWGYQTYTIIAEPSQ